MTTPESPLSASLVASGGSGGPTVPVLDLGGSGPCLECDSPHLFGERCAPDSSSTRTSPSDHVELGACGHRIDDEPEWHTLHLPECMAPGSAECTCPNVCSRCCDCCPGGPII